MFSNIDQLASTYTLRNSSNSQMNQAPPGPDQLKERIDVHQVPGGSGHYTAIPQQNPHFSQPQTYHQSHGYGHTYHPPPQYNTPPPLVPSSPMFGGGIHYSYLLLMALAFATVVQLTKGGLFAHHELFQRPQFVYPTTVATTTPNLRVPNNNYYMTNGMMNGGAMMMGNNPNMMYQQPNTNMMMNNNPNMMMMNGVGAGGVNMQPVVVPQQGVIVSGTTTAAVAEQQPATTVVATEESVAVATEESVAVSTTTDASTEPVAASTESSMVIEDVGEEVESSSSTSSSSGNAEAIESLKLSELDNFKNTWEEWEPSDTPVFFHIPKAGGSTIKDIIGTCHRFIAATEAGITDGHADDEEIAIVYPGGGPAGQDRTPFVNVDTTTIDGIARAKAMGFADSGLADVVVTPFIYEANDLFTPTAKGRLFTVFRHPIDRAISLFYYLQVADWEPTYDPELKNWSIKEYAESSRIENNWLTRQLSNQLSGELHEEDLQLAMEVVRSKFLVGLMTEIDATMTRCEQFFHWTYHVNPPNQEKCREALLSGGSNSNKSNKKEKPQPGSEDWELLAWQNQFDLQLYEYIESLFEEQAAFVAGVPDDFRMVDSTCCKCGPPTFPPEGFECPKSIPF